MVFIYSHGSFNALLAKFVVVLIVTNVAWNTNAWSSQIQFTAVKFTNYEPSLRVNNCSGYSIKIKDIVDIYYIYDVSWTQEKPVKQNAPPTNYIASYFWNT